MTQRRASREDGSLGDEAARSTILRENAVSSGEHRRVDLPLLGLGLRLVGRLRGRLLLRLVLGDDRPDTVRRRRAWASLRLPGGRGPPTRRPGSRSRSGQPISSRWIGSWTRSPRPQQMRNDGRSAARSCDKSPSLSTQDRRRSGPSPVPVRSESSEWGYPEYRQSSRNANLLLGLIFFHGVASLRVLATSVGGSIVMEFEFAIRGDEVRVVTIWHSARGPIDP